MLHRAILRSALLAAALAVPLPLLHGGQEEAVVVDEDGLVEEAVVIDDDGLVDEALVEHDSAAGTWSALPVEPRELDGQRVFMRQSSDAFADPDQRMSLEPKYVFVLEPSDIPRAGTSVGGPSVADSVAAGATARWLDDNSTAPEMLVALSAAPGQLQVGKLADGALVAAKSREVTDEIVDCDAPLATWDFPPAWKSKAALLSRLIAVLKCVDDRYCVDFYNASLHPDADCRVWLTPRDHAFGAPRGVYFIELPILKEDQSVQPVAVCAVDFEQQPLAFDFPLCRPALMEQMQRMAANRPAAAGDAPAGPDLTRLIGADLLEEFARRLVNGTYR